MAKHKHPKTQATAGSLVEAQPRPIDLLFPERREALSQAKCLPKPIGCGEAVTAFRDELSQKEYGISGLCQKCQDEVFKK